MSDFSGEKQTDTKQQTVMIIPNSWNYLLEEVNYMDYACLWEKKN